MKVFPSRRIVNFFIFFLLSILLLYLAFRKVDFSHVAQGFRNVSYLWIFLSLLVGLASHALRAVRWSILVEPLGKKPSFLNMFSAVMVGYIANLALPRVGEVAKCGSVSRTDGIRFESLVGTVVVGRAMDLVMLLLATITVVALKFDFFGKFIISRIFHPLRDRALQLNGYQLAAVLVVVVAFILFVRLILRSEIFGSKISLKIRSIWNGTVDGVKSIAHTNKLGQFLVLSVVMWLCYWVMTWLLLYSTPITANLTVWDGLFIMVIGSYGMVVPVQGGFGAYHIITAIALGIFGITYDDGLVFAIISHESQTFLVILGGILALIYVYIIQRPDKPKPQSL